MRPACHLRPATAAPRPRRYPQAAAERARRVNRRTVFWAQLEMKSWPAARGRPLPAGPRPPRRAVPRRPATGRYHGASWGKQPDQGGDPALHFDPLGHLDASLCDWLEHMLENNLAQGHGAFGHPAAPGLDHGDGEGAAQVAALFGPARHTRLERAIQPGELLADIPLRPACHVCPQRPQNGRLGQQRALHSNKNMACPICILARDQKLAGPRAQRHPRLPPGTRDGPVAYPSEIRATRDWTHPGGNVLPQARQPRNPGTLHDPHGDLRRLPPSLTGTGSAKMPIPVTWYLTARSPIPVHCSFLRPSPRQRAG